MTKIEIHQSEINKKDISEDTINDVVNHPSHYTQGRIECIDAMQASMSKEEFTGYLRGNILKYIWRFPYKNNIEDLKKAEWYLKKLIDIIK